MLGVIIQKNCDYIFNDRNVSFIRNYFKYNTYCYYRPYTFVCYSILTRFYAIAVTIHSYVTLS